LAQEEFVVYGNDHRGHGLTATSKENLSDFGRGGFDQLVEDMVSLRGIAKKEPSGKLDRSLSEGEPDLDRARFLHR